MTGGGGGSITGGGSSTVGGGGGGGSTAGGGGNSTAGGGGKGSMKACGGVGGEDSTAGEGSRAAGGAVSSGVSEKERSTEVMSSSGRVALSEENQPRYAAPVISAAWAASAQARAQVARMRASRISCLRATRDRRYCRASCDRRYDRRFPPPSHLPGNWPSPRRRP